MSKRAIVIISPPFPLLPNERQVISLTFNDLTRLFWYEALYGRVSEFPEITQHIFRYIVKNLPPVCQRCDIYTCISTPEKMTLSIGLNLARLIHKDITQNLYRFLERTYNIKTNKLEESFLDLTPELVVPYRLTISFAYMTHDLIDIPHRGFIFFSLPEDSALLLEELNKLFEEFDYRFYFRPVHILVTLERFKNIPKGFLRGIVPIEYALGALVDYDYDPVDWSWVDNKPFRDPSTQFFSFFFITAIIIISIFILFSSFLIFL